MAMPLSWRKCAPIAPRLSFLRNFSQQTGSSTKSRSMMLAQQLKKRPAVSVMVFRLAQGIDIAGLNIQDAPKFVHRNERGSTEIILIQRGKQPLQGYWTFPGGSVNCKVDPETGELTTPIESVEEAGAREVLEECKIDIRVLSPFSNVVTPGYSIDQVMAFAPFVVQPIAADDAKAAGWVDTNSILEVDGASTSKSNSSLSPSERSKCWPLTPGLADVVTKGLTFLDQYRQRTS